MGYDTHLLVLFDDAGKITSAAKIDQAGLDREGLGRVSLTAEGRHFAQVELTNDLRDASGDELLERYAIAHEQGRNARVIERERS
jgi:hypothetical protein